MSSGRALALVALGCLGLATRAQGQDEAALRRHAERLSAAYAHAQALAARRDTAQSRQIPVDTIRVGALRIVTVPSVTSRARAAAESAWPLLSATFGAGADVIGQTTLVVDVYAQPEGSIRALPPFAFVSAPRASDARTIAHGIITQGSQLVAARQDSALRTWLSGTLFPPLAVGDRLDLVYEDLATSPFSKAQQCFVGDRTACQAALGLSGSDDPILHWFDAIDRRRLAVGFTSIVRVGDRATITRCTEGGPDSTCVAALRAVPIGAIVGFRPLAAGDRVTLAAVALELGGPGAYDRLVAAPRRPIAGRLTAASGLAADSLVAVWRMRVLAARPHTLAYDPRGLWTAVLWGTLLGVIALRSTRWR